MGDPNLSSFIWSVADLLRGDYKQSDLTTRRRCSMNRSVDARTAAPREAGASAVRRNPITAVHATRLPPTTVELRCSAILWSDRLFLPKSLSAADPA